MLKQGLELKQQQKLSPLQIQTIKLIDVPTDDQRADFLTKTLRGEAFWRHVSALLLVSK